MRKKTIAIVAVVVCVLVGIALAIVLNVSQDRKEADGPTDDIEIVKDMDISGGIEESLFNEEPEAAELIEEDAIENEEQKSNSSNSAGSGSSQNKDDNASAEKPSAGEELDYESFHAMKPSDQQAYMESFDDIDAFFNWYNAAREKYEKDNPSIEVDGGSVDLDKIAN